MKRKKANSSKRPTALERRRALKGQAMMVMPREFELLECEASNFPGERFLLTYSRERGFFEPLTNQCAKPIIGEITEWRYVD